MTRGHRVDEFYHKTLDKHYEEFHRLPKHDVGPFRSEFVHWTRHWKVESRALWAWHHREYIDEPLWTEWMGDPAFAAEIGEIQRKNVPVEVGYLPPEYESTSPVFVYNDEYLKAAYNPIPFLVVLKLKSLKPDEKTDWIGTAAEDSLVSKLSAMPGVFLAEREQVAGVMRDQKLRESDAAEPDRAAQIGKALDVQQAVVGSYVVDGEKVLFNLRIVDVQTGVVQTGISNTVSRDHLLDAMPTLASSLADALGFQTQEESPSNAIQPNSVWRDEERTLTILERKGDTFRARFETRNAVREVTGLVKDNQLSWLAKDSHSLRGGPSGDNFGTINGDRIDFTFGANGKFNGKFTLSRACGN
jgi:TolB-like protein